MPAPDTERLHLLTAALFAAAPEETIFDNDPAFDWPLEVHFDGHGTLGYAIEETGGHWYTRDTEATLIAAVRDVLAEPRLVYVDEKHPVLLDREEAGAWTPEWVYLAMVALAFTLGCEWTIIQSSPAVSEFEARLRAARLLGWDAIFGADDDEEVL